MSQPMSQDTAPLQLWHNDYDFVVARSAAEAAALAAAHFGEWREEEDLEEEAWSVWPHPTLSWQDECGSSPMVERTPGSLIKQHGEGYLGSTEC